MPFVSFVRIAVPVARTVFVLLALNLIPSSPAFGERWTDPSGRTWDLTPIPGEWLLRFGAEAAATDVESILSRAGFEVLREFGPRTRTAIVRTATADGAATTPPVASMLESAVPVFRDDEGFRKYLLPGRLTVQFSTGMSAAEAESRIAASGSVILRRYQTPGYYQISVPQGDGTPSDPGTGSVFAAVRSWSARSDVRFVEPVYLGFDDALMETPNDPFFSNQWGLRNPGNGSWHETADVWADGAWWMTKGSPGVVIAFIDTGMDMNHEDLAPSLLPQNGEDWDFLDPDSVPQDLDNHGTLVTGIASAVRGNGLGVSGLAPDCPVMPLRVSLDEGEIAERVDAIQYCASRRSGFDGIIVNCSWGSSSGDFTSVRLAIQDAVQAGCVVVCSAGNSNSSVIYPARYPEPIAVGATSPCDERKHPSSCDGEAWGSCFGPELDVVAPGVRIWTTDRTGNLGLSTTNYWGFFNGTSASASFVSALCALVQSVAPGLAPAQIRDIIEQSADDGVGDPSEDTPGFDDYMGWGRINSWRALVLATHPEGIVDDLELPDPYWRHETVAGTGDDPWHLTNLENHTEGGAQCWSGADEGTGIYLPGTDAALYLPDVWVPGNGELVFWHRMDAFTLSASVAADGGFLEGSVDGGESWFLLQPEGGYTHTLEDSDGDPYPLGQEVFSGSFDWREESVDLSPHAGSAIRIRFRFGSRSDAPLEELGAGWRIDDVSVVERDISGLASGPSEGEGPGLSLERLPPIYVSGGRLRFSLSHPAVVRIAVFSASGRRIASESLGWLASGIHETGLDGLFSGSASGSYWVRLRSGTDHATGRILVVE